MNLWKIEENNLRISKNQCSIYMYYQTKVGVYQQKHYQILIRSLMENNTRSSQHILATARTKTYQNSCLQKALRIKRDGFVNKYTNPRKAETTTPEYITVIQDLKQQSKKSLRSDYKASSSKQTNYRINNHN